MSFAFDTPYAWTNISRAPDDFVRQVILEANKRGWDGNALLGHISIESGFNPAIKNPQPGQTASGLIQIIESTAQSLGTTTAAIRGMNHMQQIPLIFAFFDKYSKGRALKDGDYRLIGYGLSPSLADSSVLWKSDSKLYALNKYEDSDNKGFITAGDIRRNFRSKMSAAQARGFWAPSGIQNSSPMTSGLLYAVSVPSREVRYLANKALSPTEAQSMFARLQATSPEAKVSVHNGHNWLPWTSKVH